LNWQTFISTLVGGLITFSAILLTNALDLSKRKRTHEKLIHALLQGLRDEITGSALCLIVLAFMATLATSERSGCYENDFQNRWRCNFICLTPG
jgi:hypothetical protein